MMADGLEQQRPIDAVEEALDVEIKHPVGAPTPLTSHAHGIKCRSAGPVTIGIGMEHRLHPRRYSDPRGVCHLDVCLGIRATGSHVPYESLVELRAGAHPR